MTFTIENTVYASNAKSARYAEDTAPDVLKINTQVTVLSWNETQDSWNEMKNRPNTSKLKAARGWE